jgi:GDP-L-fucose synthase
MIKRETGFEGELVFDQSFPDGTPRKLMDTSKINLLGWYPKIELEDGIRNVCQSFQQETRGVEPMRMAVRFDSQRLATAS